MTKYALVGAAGYVAPKHMKAIKETGGDLVLAHDPHDSVGILDSYFPDCDFTTSATTFINTLRNIGVDYLVICTPNNTHLIWCEIALDLGIDVICEKPVVLHSRQLYFLQELEKQTGHKVYSILQLRYALDNPQWGCADSTISITYHTPRGKWYKESWKGDNDKSGGLLTNIGIHLFDYVLWQFGNEQDFAIEHVDPNTVSGSLRLSMADVKFDLSIQSDLTPRREFIVNGRAYDMSPKFHDLHTRSYRSILDGFGWTLEDCEPSIELVERMRK